LTEVFELIRLSETIDRFIEMYTDTNKPEELKKWRVERAKCPEARPEQGMK
jgi:hypothetical protein